ncbi:MAG TPA: hypothetical protein VE621_08760 [Bryobacteraceae bacterium]|nr:hypothetical protein [Bryobacteraceae bacterium]
MSSLASLPATGGDLKTGIEDSLKRLKGALGDKSIDPSEGCAATAKEKEDYSGPCPVCGKDHGIANTPESQALAKKVFDEVKANGFSPDLPYDKLSEKGNMVGVLIGVAEDGTTKVIKAFSGQVGKTGIYDVPGWAEAVPTKFPAVTEELSKKFDEAQAALTSLQKQIPEVNDLASKAAEAGKAAEKLVREGKQKDSDLQRDLKQLSELKPPEDLSDTKALGRYQSKLETVQGRIAEAQKRIKELESEIPEAQKLAETAKQLATAKRDEVAKLAGVASNKIDQELKRREKEFKDASAALLDDFAKNREIQNFNEEVDDVKKQARSFEEAIGNKELSHNGQCGWCAAPKLLAEAKKQGITPVSMTEFWMGKELDADKSEGNIVPSCKFCKSFIGFALCGLEKKQEKLAESLGETI